MPTWSIVDSRVWKAQIGYLSRHFDVITFDGRGCGRSDRPTEARLLRRRRVRRGRDRGPGRHRGGRAVLVGLSCGASLRPARGGSIIPSGWRACSPSPRPAGSGRPPRARGLRLGSAVYDASEGWAKYNRDYWRRGGYADFVEFFMAQFFPEPHSTKQIEDLTGWALEADPEIVIACTDGRLGCDGAICPSIEPVCAAVSCPVVIMHGLEDRIRPHATARQLAELTGGDLIELEGVGHGPLAREPVLVNPRSGRWSNGSPPRPLRPHLDPSPVRAARGRSTCSSPIGLGHARRDLAIASELRTRTRTSRSTGWPSTRSPGCSTGRRAGPSRRRRWLANESAHIEAEARRARPARLPGHPPDGRDPGRQLHGLRRRRGRRRATTS